MADPSSTPPRGRGAGGGRLYLVRHPRPQVAVGICYGRSDLPLAEDVAAVAGRIKALLPPVPVFSSPLSRCRLLAEALHAKPIFDPRLRETDFGSWEMRPWHEIERAALDAWAADPLHFAGHGGESVAMLSKRVVACIEEIASQHDEAVLVAHAGVLKVLVGALTGMPQKEWFGFSFDFGTVSLIENGHLVWHNEPAVVAATAGVAQ